jgi:hypothetical protein
VHYFQQHSPVHTKIDDRWKRDDNAKPTPEMLRAKSQATKKEE